MIAQPNLRPLAWGLVIVMFHLQPALAADPPEVVVLEEKSAFSKIRVTRAENVLTLWFVPDAGQAIVESRVNLDRPHELVVPYTRWMFLSYVFQPKPKRVLLVGLGGGAMVHFLKHHDPQLKIDVVEIDPAIVKIADKHFGIRSEGNVQIHTRDAFAYLKETEVRYDAIYLDAFLKPATDTDGNGVPLRLKTQQFYKDVQKKLTAEGVVVYNIHPHEKYQEDVQNIRASFAQTYLFRLPNFSGYVAVGSRADKRLTVPAVRAAADELDQRFRTTYSLREMAERLAP